MKKQSGISLSEALVSLFLSTLILTLLIQCYVRCKQEYQAAETLLETHFDARWAGELLRDSIRRAGFTPCLGIDALHVRYNGERIHGMQIEKQPQYLIQINRMSSHFFEVSVKNRMQISVPSATLLNEKYPLLIADCMHAEIQHIAYTTPGINETVITLSNPLLFDYGQSTYVGEFIQEQWFIKNKALFYNAHQTEEITPLIHSLKVTRQLVHEKSFVEITMGLFADKKYTMLVAVRGS